MKPCMVALHLGRWTIFLAPPRLRQWITFLALLKQNLLAAQSRMKLQADQHWLNKSFEVGDQVYLRLQPYRQLTLRSKGFNKFSPRYYGPFHILKKLGSVAYQLALPSDCLLRPIFQFLALRSIWGLKSFPFSLYLLLILILQRVLEVKTSLFFSLFFVFLFFNSIHSFLH